MTIVYRDMKKLAAKNALALGVSSSGLVITVAAGTFTIEGTGYSLVDDTDHTVTPDATYATGVQAFLVLDGGNVALLVDEVLHDGIDEPYQFTRGGAYSPLLMIYECLVPAAAADLDAVDIIVSRFVAAPEHVDIHEDNWPNL